MKFTLSNDSSKTANVELLIVPVRAKKVSQDASAAGLDKAVTAALVRCAKDEGFEGNASQTLKVPAQGSLKAKWIVLVGIGAESDPVKASRLVGHAAAKSSRRQKSAAIVMV